MKMDVEHHIEKIIESGGGVEEWLKLIKELKSKYVDRDVLRQIHSIALNNSKKEPTVGYKKLMIGFAKLQSEISHKLAEETFLDAKAVDFDCAVIQVFQAQFHYENNEKHKARQIITAAKKNGCVPKILLKIAYRNWRENKENLLVGIDDPWDASLIDITTGDTLSQTQDNKIETKNREDLKQKDDDVPIKRLTMPIRGPSSSRKLNKLSNEAPACTPRTTKLCGRKTLPIHLFDDKTAKSTKTSRRGVGMSPFMNDFSPLIKQRDDFYYNSADTGIFKTLFPKTNSDSVTQLKACSSSNLCDLVNDDACISTTPTQKGKLKKSVSSPCILSYLEKNGSIIPNNETKLQPQIVAETSISTEIKSNSKTNVIEDDIIQRPLMETKSTFDKENIDPKKEVVGLDQNPEKDLHCNDEKCEINNAAKINHVIPSDEKNNIASHIDDGLAKLEQHGFQTNPISKRKERFYLVKGKCYEEIQIIGKGGSCKVFQVVSESGYEYALKKVNLTDIDQLTMSMYMNEIKWLEKMKGNEHIIHLHDWDTVNNNLLIVLEKGDCDLAAILRTEKVISKNDVKKYWKQMLTAVSTIHKHGIVHADLKPANFLCVGNMLKLIDFGIANGIQDDRTSVTRESQMGTLNYMPPELIQDKTDNCRISKSSDVWSLGCILYYMVYKKTPYGHVKNHYARIYALSSEEPIKYKKIDDPLLMNCLQGCLKHKKTERYSIQDLLAHPYLHEV